MAEEIRSQKARRIEIEKMLKEVFPNQNYDVFFSFISEYCSREMYIVDRVIRKRSGFLGLKTTKSLEKVLEITPGGRHEYEEGVREFVLDKYMNINVKVLTESEMERARRFAQNFESLTNAKARVIRDY